MKNYVTVFNGHEVPEGSTHQASDTSFVLFAKWIGNHRVFFDVRNESWVEDKLIDWHFFKELPEAKWVPVVGEECDVNIGANEFFVLAKIRYISKQIVISDVDGHEVSSQASITTFRKIKSAKDLEREAFVAGVRDCIHDADLHASDMISMVANSIFNAGYTAPKEVK
jgi:hypothetical protein